MKPRNAGKSARRPKSTDRKDFSAKEIREGFLEKFPGFPLDELLADPANRDLTRRLNASLTKWALLETAVRSFKSRGDGELAPYFFKALPAAIRLDAQITGNLGEREIELPADPVAMLAQMAGLTAADLLEVWKNVPQLSEKQEKVINAEPASRKKA